VWQDETVKGPWRDEIVEEIRRIRQEQAAQFNYDVRAIIEDARKRQQESDHEVVSFPPCRPQVMGKPTD
jgi:hypothetical protein